MASVSDLLQPRSISGHGKLREGKRRTTWYAKWRDARGEQYERRLGPAWTGKGPPPPGYLREREAKAALEAILTDARRGAVEQVRTGVTFALAAEDWIAYGVRERDWKPSTLLDNRSVVHAHLLPAFGTHRVENLSARQIEQWRNELVDERGLSRRTANKALIVLGAILERACQAHGLTANPVREIKKLRDRYDPNQYDFYNPEEVEALVAAAGSAQDAAIYRTAAFTGLRMGELIALRWSDVDFDSESLHVYSSYSAGTLTAPKSGLARTSRWPSRSPRRSRRCAPAARARRATISSSPASAASTSTTPRCVAATRTPSSAPASGRCASTTCATPSARSPSTRQPSFRSKPGWGTPTSTPP